MVSIFFYLSFFPRLISAAEGWMSTILAAEIVSLVWGTPGNFNGFRVLAALLHGPLVVGVSQTAALNRGRHLYLAGRPSRWASAHIVVSVFFARHVVTSIFATAKICICKLSRYFSGGVYWRGLAVACPLLVYGATRLWGESPRGDRKPLNVHTWCETSMGQTVRVAES